MDKLPKKCIPCSNLKNGSCSLFGEVLTNEVAKNCFKCSDCGNMSKRSWYTTLLCDTCMLTLGNERLASFCEGCDLSKKCRTNNMLGVGKEDAEIMVVGEAPGYAEDLNGVPFFGEPKVILENILEHADLPIEHVYITNVVKCKPVNNSNPKIANVKACLPILFSEIKRVKPQKILAFGNIAFKALTGNDGILSKHGTCGYKFDNIDVYPFLHPKYIERFPIYENITKNEVKNAILGNSALSITFDKCYINNPLKLDRLFNFLDDVPNFAFDIETTSLNPYINESKLCSFSVANENYACGVDLRIWDDTSIKMLMDKLKLFLESTSIQKLIHNVLFEYGYLRQLFDIKINNVYDVMMAHHVCHEEFPHDLDSLGTIYLGYSNYKDNFKQLTSNYKNMMLPTTKELLNYNNTDVIVTYRLKRIFDRLMKDEGVESLFTHISMPMTMLMAKMAYYGIGVDVSIMRSLTVKYTKLITFFLNKIRQITFDDEFNPNSDQQLRKYFFKTKMYQPIKKTDGGDDSVDAEVLTELAEKDTVAKLLLEYKKYEKLKSVYLINDDPTKGFFQHLDPNNRIHSSLKPHGTKTGRPSSSNPNLLNIGRESELRSMFVAKPGYYFCDADYSQFELRILALYSQDKRLISAYNDGKDVHDETAINCLGALPDNVDKETRVTAKRVNFGIIYGIGPKGLASLINSDLGYKKYSVDAAKGLIDAFYNYYVGVYDFMQDIEHQVYNNGYVTNMFGRRRRFPDMEKWKQDERRYFSYIQAAYRQAKNFPMQSTANDLSSIAAVAIDNDFRERGLDARILLHVYDEFVTESSEKVPRFLVGSIVKQHMENPPIEHNLPIKVDVEYVKAWKQKTE